MRGFLILLLVVVLLLRQCPSYVLSAREVKFLKEVGRKADPASAGADGAVPSSGFTQKPSAENWLENWVSTKCEETHGSKPCTSAFGNVFLMVVFGYLLFFSATLMYIGSAILLPVMGSGIIRRLFLPILGALPGSLLFFVCGLSGSKTTAQSQVLIGMRLLAGLNVMLLTVLWGVCAIVGKCDLSPENAAAIDEQDTKGFSFFGSGITTDRATTKAARFMLVSLIPFIIVEISQAIDSSSAKRIGVLVGCIAAIICLLSYFIYQVLQPWIQKSQVAYVKEKYIVSAIMKIVHSKEWGRLLREDGQPNQDVLKSVFEKPDHDNDGYLTKDELSELLSIELQGPDSTDAVNKVMAVFDSSRDDKLSLDEFKVRMSRWLRIAISTVGHSKSNNYSKKFISDFHSKAKEELEDLQNEIEEVSKVDNPYTVYLQAVMLMLAGAIFVGIFADLLVDAVDNFSDATSIPSFFISFIIMPLATNSSEGVSAIIFASRKKKRTASLTYSEIYGAVTMNNTLCLGVFLAIIYFRGLDWDFSAEVLVIVLVVLVMGLLSSFRTTFPLWMSSIAFILYPLTLAIVYVLDYVLGWS